MDLYLREETSEGDMFCHATLDDLKAALTEHGMVAVPVVPEKKLITDMTNAGEDYKAQAAYQLSSQLLYNAMEESYKAMTATAEPNQS